MAELDIAKNEIENGVSFSVEAINVITGDKAKQAQLYYQLRESIKKQVVLILLFLS